MYIIHNHNIKGGENLNGLEYRKLLVEEQVNWLNEKLQKHELKKVAAELCMSTSTLTNGIRAAGFKFDRAAKQYVIATLNNINEDKQLIAYLTEDLIKPEIVDIRILKFFKEEHNTHTASHKIKKTGDVLKCLKIPMRVLLYAPD